MTPETASTRPWSGTIEEQNGWHVARYDPTNQNASEAVVFALAAVVDADPEALSPLHWTIDTDALDNLFAPTIDGRSRGGGEVTFAHDGCAVVIDHDGEIRVREVTDTENGSTAGFATESD